LNRNLGFVSTQILELDSSREKYSSDAPAFVLWKNFSLTGTSRRKEVKRCTANGLKRFCGGIENEETYGLVFGA
jgi:hypothetical protein